MSFSWKEAIKDAIATKKRRKKIFEKNGRLNEAKNCDRWLERQASK